MNKSKHERALRWLAGHVHRNRVDELENTVQGKCPRLFLEDRPFTEFLYQSAMKSKDILEFGEHLRSASSELYFCIHDLEPEPTWKYIITGDGCMAFAVNSKMPWDVFTEYIRVQSQPKSKAHHPVFHWGTLEFINPVVHSLAGFGEAGTALIGMSYNKKRGKT